MMHVALSILSFPAVPIPVPVPVDDPAPVDVSADPLALSHACYMLPPIPLALSYACCVDSVLSLLQTSALVPRNPSVTS